MALHLSVTKGINPENQVPRKSKFKILIPTLLDFPRALKLSSPETQDWPEQERAHSSVFVFVLCICVCAYVQCVSVECGTVCMRACLNVCTSYVNIYQQACVLSDVRAGRKGVKFS